MTERTFRIILGSVLLVILYFEWPMGVYAYIGVLLFEGITNCRIPLVLTRLSGKQGMSGNPCASDRGKAPARFNFEAERALRLVIVAFLILSYVVFPEALWFFPWFIGFALIGAGLSGICPMALALRWVGFR